MHGTITSGPQPCENCGHTHGYGWNTLSTSTLTLGFNVFGFNVGPRTSADELLEEADALASDYARIGRMRLLAVNATRYRSEAPRFAPARAPCVPLRLLGGRQSYARVRCDRRRKQERQMRNEGVGR